MEIEPYGLNGYQLQRLSYQDNLVEFLWCMEDLRIVKNNAYHDITLDDISDILDMMKIHGMKSKLKEIKK